MYLRFSVILSGVVSYGLGLLTINNLSVLSLIPVFDRIIYPFFHLRGVKKSLLRRMIVGFVFVILSMIAAGIVEQERRAAYSPSSMTTSTIDTTNINATQISPCQNVDDFNPILFQQWSAIPVTNEDPPLTNIDKPVYCHAICDQRELIVSAEGHHYYALTLGCIRCDPVPQVSSLSVLWQIPQFFLMGIAEVLTVVSALDFFYEQVPPSMRSVASACNLGTCALGAFLAVPVLCAANYWDGSGPWVSNDLDDGDLDKYFFLLAGLMALDGVLFWFYYMNYVERTFDYVIKVDSQIAHKDHSPDTSRHRSSSLTDLFIDSASSSSSLSSSHFKHISKQPFGKHSVYTSLLSHAEVDTDEMEDTPEGGNDDEANTISVGVTQ